MHDAQVQEMRDRIGAERLPTLLPSVRARHRFGQDVTAPGLKYESFKKRTSLT